VVYGNISEHTRAGLLAFSGLNLEDGAPFISVIQHHFRSGVDYTIPWPFDGDCIDETTGEWYWSPVTEYDDAYDDEDEEEYEYVVIPGTWSYVYGCNGSINEYVWIEHPKTWHFYGFIDDEVHSVPLLQPLLRPMYGPEVGLCERPEIATQCNLQIDNSLSFLRSECITGDAQSGIPTYSVWDDSPPFSSAITSNLSCGKFSFGDRSRSHCSIGVQICPSDWLVDISPLPPMGVIRREFRFIGDQENFSDVNQDISSDDEYSYDPYDKD
jgi:hypothetical protein